MLPCAEPVTGFLVANGLSVLYGIQVRGMAKVVSCAPARGHFLQRVRAPDYSHILSVGPLVERFVGQEPAPLLFLFIIAAIIHEP